MGALGLFVRFVIIVNRILGASVLSRATERREKARHDGELSCSGEGLWSPASRGENRLRQALGAWMCSSSSRTAVTFHTTRHRGQHEDSVRWVDCE